jgi:hypothetical protein
MLFEFTLWLADDDRELVEWADALADAGPTDCTAGIRAGSPLVMFHRDAPTLEAAIRSARDQVQAAGLKALRCEIDEEQMAGFASRD